MLTSFRAAPTSSKRVRAVPDGQDHAQHAGQRPQHHHDLQVGDVQAATDGVLFVDEELEAAPDRRAGDDRCRHAADSQQYLATTDARRAVSVAILRAVVRTHGVPPRTTLHDRFTSER